MNEIEGKLKAGNSKCCYKRQRKVNLPKVMRLTLNTVNVFWTLFSGLDFEEVLIPDFLAKLLQGKSVENICGEDYFKLLPGSVFSRHVSNELIVKSCHLKVNNIKYKKFGLGRQSSPD